MALGLALALASTGCHSSAPRSASAPPPPPTTPIGPSTTAGSAPIGSSTTGPAGGAPAASGCSDDTATASVLAGLAAADGRSGAAELPGYTFYGHCGPSYYAVAALGAGPLATDSEVSAFGSGPATAAFFTGADGTNWTTAGRSAGSYSCASFNIPAGLRAIWGNCHVPLHAEPPGPPAAVDETTCLQYSGARTYIRLIGVQVVNDGSANLHGIPQGVHCGGPDDLQYVDVGALETLHLLPGAQVGIFDVVAGREKSEPIAQLAGYLDRPESGIFEVFGITPDLVTGIGEQFHP